jgi:hypothetical protein
MISRSNCSTSAILGVSGIAWVTPKRQRWVSWLLGEKMSGLPLVLQHGSGEA